MFNKSHGRNALSETMFICFDAVQTTSCFFLRSLISRYIFCCSWCCCCAFFILSFQFGSHFFFLLCIDIQSKYIFILYTMCEHEGSWKWNSCITIICSSRSKRCKNICRYSKDTSISPHILLLLLAFQYIFLSHTPYLSVPFSRVINNVWLDDWLFFRY